MKGHNYTFESMDDLVKAKQIPHVNPQNASHFFARNLASQGTHFVCADRMITTHAQVCETLAAQTFPAGVARVEKLATTLVAPAPVSRRRQPVRADAGDELDMSRVWQGDLENAWRTMKRQHSVGPSRILIAIDVAGSSGVRAEAMAYRGAAAFALATALLDVGYVVSIVACVNRTLLDGKHTPYRAEVVLLPPGGVLDLHKLCNLAASSLLFRGVLLDHTLRVSEQPLGEGLARSLEVQLADINSTGYDHVALVSHQENTQAAASSWLDKQIQALQTNGEQS